MKVGEFQKAIGASPVVYSRFMSQNGPNKGSNSSVYPNAAMFFKKRQLRGIKTPTKDAAPKANEPAAAATAAAVGSKVAAIELDGEKEDKVPIYGESYSARQLHVSTLLIWYRYMRRGPTQDQCTPQKAWRNTSSLPSRHRRGTQGGTAQDSVRTAQRVSQQERSPSRQHEHRLLCCVCVF